MRIVLVPAFGFSGKSSTFDRGRSIGKISESDVVDLYLPSMIDILEEERILFDVENTRQAGKCLEHYPINSIIVHLKCGWTESSKRRSNITKSYFCTPGSKSLANEIGEAVGEWGSCYVFGHQVANPVRDTQDPVIGHSYAISASIEPFALNGHGSDVYCTRLAELGRDIGTSISSYVKRVYRPSISVPDPYLSPYGHLAYKSDLP